MPTKKGKVVLLSTQIKQLNTVLTTVPNFKQIKISQGSFGVFLKAKAGRTLLRGKGNNFSEAIATFQHNLSNTMYF